MKPLVRTNDDPLFEYVGSDEDWEKLNLPKERDEKYLRADLYKAQRDIKELQNKIAAMEENYRQFFAGYELWMTMYNNLMSDYIKLLPKGKLP